MGLLGNGLSLGVPVTGNVTVSGDVTLNNLTVNGLAYALSFRTNHGDYVEMAHQDTVFGLRGQSGQIYNLSSFLTAHQSLSNYYTKGEVDNKVNAINNYNIYVSGTTLYIEEL